MIASNNVLAGQTWPAPTVVSSLISKIYKCLLTEPGSDAFDPTYGGGLRSALRGVPGQNTLQAATAATNVLNAVQSNLKDEGLNSLQLNLIAFNVSSLSWNISVLVNDAYVLTV